MHLPYTNKLRVFSSLFEIGPQLESATFFYSIYGDRIKTHKRNAHRKKLTD